MYIIQYTYIYNHYTLSMVKQQYANKVENLLDLGDLGMVEDSLKYMFENKKMSSADKKRWAVAYGKTVQMVESACEEYSNSQR